MLPTPNHPPSAELGPNPTQIDAKAHLSEALLRMAGPIAGLGGWAIDMGLGRLELTEELARMLEVPPMLPMSVDDGIELVAPESRTQARNALQACFEAGTPFDLELPLITGSGRRFWARTVGEAVRDADANIVRLQGLCFDITDQKQAAAALAHSEERYRTLVEYSPNAIGVHRHGKLLYVNPAAVRMFAAPSARALLETDVADLIHPDFHRSELTRMQDAADQHVDVPWIDGRCVKLDGTVFDVEVQTTSISYDGESAVRVAVRDTTELRRLVQAIQDQRDFATQIIDTMGQGLTVTDASGRFEFANNTYTELFGYTLADLVGKSPEEVHGIEDHALLEVQDERRRTGRKSSYELRLKRADGSVADVQVAAVPRTRDGVYAGAIAVISDISERKQFDALRLSLEQQLRESQKMEALGTLAGGIAHDFNNILATILGNVALACHEVGKNPQALTSLDEIRKAGHRGRDLAQQILAFSRRQPTDRRLRALPSLIEESVRLLRATLPNRVAINVRCATGLPPVQVDATQIEQVLVNLGTNAGHAMAGRPGRIDIDAEAVMVDGERRDAPSELPDGRYVRIKVSDDGRGMDAATLQRVFEPFFTTKPVGEGTGLGLSVVHGILRSHQGAINAHSEVGRGSTFTLYLPAAAGSVETPTAPIAAVVDGRGQHVLYIDDDPAVVSLLTRTLRRHGYRVSGFSNQQEGIAALRAAPHEFDLAITDFNMPGMSGLEVASAISAIRPDLPIAMASGYITDELRAQALAVGIRDLIFKASDAEKLGAVVQRLLAGTPLD